MKGYKKVNIPDNKGYKEISICSCTPGKIFLILVIISILIFTSYFLFFYNDNSEDQINLEFNSKNVKLTKNTEEEKINIEKERIRINKEIKHYESKLRKITKEEMLSFRKINSLGILYDANKYPRSENPDISIITTIHNQAHCIHKAIRSVQNQSLKNWEIIIIDDCSLDNSTQTVELYMKEDSRITLIENDINEGIMITRNKGIRKAKGKYICILDADDSLAHKDILKYSFEIAEMGHLDVVEFWTAYFKENNFKGYYHYHGINMDVIYQPELKTKFYDFKDIDNYRAIKCRTVWGKIVKNNVYQKTLDVIPKKYSDDFILGFEDTMITVSMFNVAQSFYLMNHTGYYYTFDERKGRFPLAKNRRCIQKAGIIKDLDHLKFLEFLIDVYDDNYFYKQVIYHELKAINNYTYSNFKRTIKKHFDWAYKILDELLNSQYLSQIQKDKVELIKNDVQDNENKYKNKKNKDKKIL